MLFHSWEFWIFFLIVLPFFYGTPLRIGRFILLGASYVFYMWWNPRLVVLIMASTLVDYIAGHYLPRVSGARRKILLLCSLVTNLSLLGFFKYYNFFVSSFAGAFGLQADSWTLQIVLPVGISFYTFQSMSYTIDIYRGQLRPVSNLVDFALFVAFFPQLVAGPIVRAREFLPQLAAWTTPLPERLQEGFILILSGLIKKLVFADNFAQVSDAYFSNVAASPGILPAWTGTMAFAMQIFFDFSGYTDIARGCAKLLGFDFPVNFRRPYLATDITEFWRRWHISLSSWLRDYLYIPLGGNRLGRFGTYRNLAITMLLGGLWHGASWNFVFWGGYHGVLLALHRRFRHRRESTPATRRVPVVVAATAFNFFLVLIGWIFFRAESFSDSWTVLSNMFSFQQTGASLLHSGLWILIGLSLIIALFEEHRQLSRRLVTAPGWVRVAFYTLSFFALELFSAGGDKIPFVYFQF